MGRDGYSGSWPREDSPIPAQRCGIVLAAEPNSSISTGLSQSVAGVGLACAGSGCGLPSTAAHTNSRYFLPHFPLLKNWLTESAKLIAQSGRTVEWVTPLGLPIVQPYYRSRTTVVSIWCAGLNYPSLCHGGEEGEGSWASRQQAKSRQVGITCG